MLKSRIIKSAGPVHTTRTYG